MGCLIERNGVVSISTVSDKHMALIRYENRTAVLRLWVFTSQRTLSEAYPTLLSAPNEQLQVWGKTTRDGTEERYRFRDATNGEVDLSYSQCTITLSRRDLVDLLGWLEDTSHTSMSQLNLQVAIPITN